MKTVHLPLPEDVHSLLVRHARATGESATALARAAVEKLVWELEREAIRAQVAAYAAEMAGTDHDLDPEWEDAGLDVWRRTE